MAETAFMDSDDYISADDNFYERLKSVCYKDSFVDALCRQREEVQATVHYSTVDRLFRPTVKAAVLSLMQQVDSSAASTLDRHNEFLTTTAFNALSLSSIQDKDQLSEKERDLRVYVKDLADDYERCIASAEQSAKLLSSDLKSASLLKQLLERK